MPLYEYQCEACGKRFEVIRKFSDPPLETCTLCGKGPIQRLLSSPAIQFKGSGWYITDYSQKGKSSESTSATKETSATSDAKSSDAKKDATTSTTTPSSGTAKADS
jgi:putative FmdB family regulatory protein